MAIPEQWPYLLEPGLKAIFFQQVDSIVAESKIPMLFKELPSQKAAEEFLGIGGMGDWNEFKGKIEYDDMDQGYKTTLTHTEYVKGFKVARKLVDDDLYNVINEKPETLGIAAGRTREKHAASIFNNAFSSSYTGGDAVSLCNDSHPLAPTHATDVVDNAGSSALSYEAVVETRRIMKEFTDDREELVTVVPDTLLVPAELEETAWAIWKTMNKVDTADQHANFVQGFLKQVIVWDYLTDANNWYVIDSRLAKSHLLWVNRVMPEFAFDPTGGYDLEARYRGYMRYSYGWRDWRWVYGHKVT